MKTTILAYAILAFTLFVGFVAMGGCAKTPVTVAQPAAAPASAGAPTDGGAVAPADAGTAKAPEKAAEPAKAPEPKAVEPAKEPTPAAAKKGPKTGMLVFPTVTTDDGDIVIVSIAR